ncbi:MAG: (2Fe-2S) ferredoxin domain-containing protein [Clostridiales bacterium]|jgi:NADP-reducing hydrogenase subunit HndB|nr:(2Fe-2S) ferredoxin domain-containing protein [Clostridiales bacterium]
MSKIKSLDELKKIREEAKNSTSLRTTGENPDRVVIKVGMATCGIAAGARVVMGALIDEIARLQLENVSVMATGCVGMCYAEPIVEVHTPGRGVIRYGNVSEKLARDIIEKHIVAGELLEDVIVGREA